MSQVPNVDFGNPVIFFDSHPEEQEGYLYSYWSSLVSTLKIAWTGDVPKQLMPGKLRMVWWTTEGTQGVKDYELHQYELVRNNFDGLLALPEVRRCLITGYSGQNPFVMSSNPWADADKKFKRDKKAQEERNQKQAQRLDDSKEGRQGTLVDIESVIKSNEKAEEERRRRADEEDTGEEARLIRAEMEED
ncbi:hypothetical protein PVAG01_03423 [Phlyctema vagabunda]|uniref:Uncharacterized protein n=1 Tax=Phlyctema vagabunda TaxID=108571 RepID=A0ABR4PLC7_9HELO